MKNTMLLMLLMMTTELSIAQPGSPFFTERNSTDSSTVPRATEKPLIDPNSRNNSTIELEAVIAESFFRRVWYGIVSEDPSRKQVTYSRFKINDQQAAVLQRSLEGWLDMVTSDTDFQREKMCSYWINQSVNGASLVLAEAALDLYESLEPDRSRIEERLQILIADIMSTSGEDFANFLLSELDIDYERRTNLQYTSWANSVRSRNNLVEQMEFTCGGVK
jgi:hypothetical protein